MKNKKIKNITEKKLQVLNNKIESQNKEIIIKCPKCNSDEIKQAQTSLLPDAIGEMYFYEPKYKCLKCNFKWGRFIDSKISFKRRTRKH